MSTKTLTLTEFLLARIAEDEAFARVAAGLGGRFPAPEWEFVENGAYTWNVQTVATFGEGYPTPITRDGEGLSDSVDLDAGPHIARHDPARVLAECEAKRQIIHQHGAGEGHECPDGFMDSAETDPHTGWENDCRTLKFLAAVYADHPDHQDEWRV